MNLTIEKTLMSSKFYKASGRKQTILAAVDDPINLELVEQMREYLSPESEALLEQVEEKNELIENLERQMNEDEKSSGSDSESSNDSSSMSGGMSGGGGGGFSSGDFDEPAPGETYEDEGELEDSLDDTEDVTDEEATEPPPPASEAKASKEVDGTAVKATWNALPGYSYPQISQDPESIKGTLNMLNGTAGVTRVCIKNKEMWIYYNDSINLNNVMPKVIEMMIGTGLSYLNFNRLARSDNAIVFDINLMSPMSNLDQIKEIENAS